MSEIVTLFRIIFHWYNKDFGFQKKSFVIANVTFYKTIKRNTKIIVKLYYFIERSGEDKKVMGEIEDARIVDRAVKKLLLLGAGGSGKSTFFKQLANLHAGGFQTRDRKSFRDQIYEQLIDTMKLMITKCEEFFDEDATANEKFELRQSSQTSADIILATRNNSPMTSELVKHLDILWKDPAIKQAFKIRNRICVPDSTGFFLDKLSIITQDEYVPSDEVRKINKFKKTFFFFFFFF
ncbi:GTP-binding protein (p) alpha subunit, gpa1 [Reticulomyxa filosa]|uniref:GTP-binding protein (P) alpha subunit, gpa1 n=1 Tax=Reticulomyxa filosa TaxID=46433 RepID=X6MI84_RETFI|nr:GTP-binding protein (p) alpha subunit, gpa1 [Reticulomyxa filosa]|eukprot:ETO12770.1 GTP-binding protein (p) alpha subunit, gpa1 [Reticulomyxa filosa]